jgi:hypothetical protein
MSAALTIVVGDRMSKRKLSACFSTTWVGLIGVCHIEMGGLIGGHIEGGFKRYGGKGGVSWDAKVGRDRVCIMQHIAHIIEHTLCSIQSACNYLYKRRSQGDTCMDSII